MTGWPEQFAPSALLASHPCVWVKAAEMRNVCLSNAADVVPIAEARMRWPGVSSNSEWSDGLLDHQTTERLGRYDGMARQGKQSSHSRKVGPTIVSEPHLQLLR